MHDFFDYNSRINSINVEKRNSLFLKNSLRIIGEKEPLKLPEVEQQRTLKSITSGDQEELPLVPNNKKIELYKNASYLRHNFDRGYSQVMNDHRMTWEHPKVLRAKGMSTLRNQEGGSGTLINKDSVSDFVSQPEGTMHAHSKSLRIQVKPEFKSRNTLAGLGSASPYIH